MRHHLYIYQQDKDDSSFIIDSDVFKRGYWGRWAETDCLETTIKRFLFFFVVVT